MNMKTSFTLRFRNVIATHAFLAEVECDDVHAVRTACGQLLSSPGPELIAALMYFDVMSSPNLTPDDIAEKVFFDLCDALKVNQETWQNEVMGSYDRMTNRVTPVCMGGLFPDGTLRVVWDEDESILGFDESLRILDNALWLLLRLAKLPQFQPTEEESEQSGNWAGPAQERITDVLFEAGLWPDAAGNFAESNADVREVLKKYSA